jgi:hypothetical protein
MGGLEWAAQTYTWTLARKSPSQGKKSPHEVEKEFRRLAASARDLMAKIQQISQDCLDLVENAALEAPPLVTSGWTTQQRFRQYSDLHAWFQMRRGHYQEDGSIEEDEPWWGEDGMRPLELRALTETFESLADTVAAKKQAPNGLRAGFTGRQTSLEWLLFHIGRMASFRKCPMTHVIPVARKIHEWATGESPGDEWGKRPFEHVLPWIKKLEWVEFGDSERLPLPAGKHDPEAGKRRLERLKAILRPQSEASVK